MKRFLAFVIISILLITLVGCGNVNNTVNKRPLIVCTVFPQYDWIANVTNGIDCDIMLLADSAIDLHNYNPTAQDIVNIGKADVFVYNGGESDDWVVGAIRNVTNKDQARLSVVETIGDNKIEFDDDGETEIDEHVWLSIKNAKSFVKSFGELLQIKYPEYKEKITENIQKYLQKLDAVDEAYKQIDWSQNTIVLADRNPFAYLIHDYSMNLDAAYYGCSAEVEVSFDTVLNLAHKINETKVQYVYVLDNSDQKIAKQVIENTNDKNASIVVINSMQSLTKHDIGNTTYVDIMMDNLNNLKLGIK